MSLPRIAATSTSSSSASTRTNSTNSARTARTTPTSKRTTLILTVCITLLIACGSAAEAANSAATAAASTANNNKDAVADEKTSKQADSSLQSIASRDDIYIDDQHIEGSGGRGEIHDDLEKEQDYSGSGFGPDDEDSSSPVHPGNSNNKPTHHSESGGATNRKDTHVDDLELGSGDKDTDDDDEDSGFVTEDEDRRPHAGRPPVDDDDLEFEPDTDNTDPKNTHQHTSTSTTTTTTTSTSSTATTDDRHPPNHHPDNNFDDDGDDDDLDDKRNNGDLSPIGGGDENDIDVDADGDRHRTTQFGEKSPPDVSIIMNAKNEDRTTSFFAQPGILAAVIGGAVVGLLCAILVVMFIVYRMRKKDEGSYALDEPKRSPAVNSYAKNPNNREFYA